MTQTSRPRLVPKVAVELDRTRQMVFSYGTMRRIEEKTGREVEEFEDGFPAVVFPIVIWATLAGEDPELTVENVEEMLYPGNVDYVAAKLDELIQASRADGEDPLEKTAVAKESVKGARHRSKSSGVSRSSTSGSKTPSSGS